MRAILLAAMTCMGLGVATPGSIAREARRTEVGSSVEDALREDAVRFRALDVVVDSRDVPLAAWQLEITLGRGASIVGVEGGEHDAFAEPPYHDPEALLSGRIVLAAFSTDDGLRRGRQRVARLHVRESGPLASEPVARVVTAGDPRGRRIPITVRLQPTRETP